jgi:hypothetical protein
MGSSWLRNPNDETGMTNQSQSPNDEAQRRAIEGLPGRHWSFVIHSDFWFRDSDFRL